LADEHISYSAVINLEVGPMAWKTRNGGLGLCGCAGRARSGFEARDLRDRSAWPDVASSWRSQADVKHRVRGAPRL